MFVTNISLHRYIPERLAPRGHEGVQTAGVDLGNSCRVSWNSGKWCFAR